MKKRQGSKGSEEEINEEGALAPMQSPRKTKKLKKARKVDHGSHQKRKKTAEARRIRARKMKAIRNGLEEVMQAKSIPAITKRGKSPDTFSYGKDEEPRVILTQKMEEVDQKIDLKTMFKTIKKIRNTSHLAFPLSIRRLGQFDDLIFTTYDDNLEKAIRRVEGKGLGHDLSVRFLYEILDGVASMHEAGYIHGDLKPDNIAISCGKIKIIDYGHAEKMHPVGKDSRSAEGYRAPGLVAHTVIDTFAMGCIFFEMLTGTPLYRVGDVQEISTVEKGKAKIASKFLVLTLEMISKLFDVKTPPVASKLVKHDLFRLTLKRRVK